MLFETMADDIAALITELKLERAAIMASGADSSTVVEWILAHAGEPEEATPATASRGLHGARLGNGVAEHRAPQRFVLPAGVL